MHTVFSKPNRGNSTHNIPKDPMGSVFLLHFVPPPNWCPPPGFGCLSCDVKGASYSRVWGDMLVRVLRASAWSRMISLCSPTRVQKSTVASSQTVFGSVDFRKVLQHALCLLIQTAAVLHIFAEAVHSPCLKPKGNLAIACFGHLRRKASKATMHTRAQRAAV